MKVNKILLFLSILLLIFSCNIEDTDDINSNENIENTSGLIIQSSTKSKKEDALTLKLNSKEPINTKCIYYKKKFIYKYTSGPNKGKAIKTYEEVLLERKKLQKLYTPSESNPCPVYRIPQKINIKYDPVNNYFAEIWGTTMPDREPTHGGENQTDEDADDDEETQHTDDDTIDSDYETDDWRDRGDETLDLDFLN